MAQRNERGVALPIALFVVTIMTVMLAAAFTRVGAEREMATGASDAVNALTVAQTGLQTYFGTRTGRPADGDSIRFNVTGGYADVVARVVRRSADTLQKELYIVRSTGYVIVPALGATAQGKRTVAQFARWQVGNMRRIAAYVAANGATDQNPANQVRAGGADQCGTTPGIGSIRGASASSLSRGTYQPTAIIGGSGTQVADTTNIDWITIVNGGFTPDYRYINTADLGYKSQMVQGDATLNNALGRGLLIVTGNLTMSGSSAHWQGIVLVGGKIIFTNGTKSEFEGLVISGLNELLSGASPQATQLGGVGGATWWHFDYCSTYVDATLAALTGLVGVPNAWVDNWATY